MKHRFLESSPPPKPTHQSSDPDRVRPERRRKTSTNEVTEVARQRHRRETALKPKDKRLLAVLGMCRALTLDQVVTLLGNPKDTRTVHNRLRALAGETGNVKLPDFGAVSLRRLRFRAFDGAPLILWAPTPTGFAIAQRELRRELTLPRGSNGGIAFAEHFIALTDLFVGLVRPYFLEGTPLREIPFGWDVADDMRLPWRELDETGAFRDRAIRPDAILTVPSARRRIFIECETGTHTLVPVRKDRPQATTNKAARYETFLRGLADVRKRVTHYAEKYPDGWTAEVLFLVPSEGRRASTETALATVAGDMATFIFRVRTLAEALADVQTLLPRASSPAETGQPPGPSSNPRDAGGEHVES